MNQLPTSAPVTDATTGPRKSSSSSGSSSSSSSSSASGRPRSKSTTTRPAPQVHKPAPRWMSHLALAAGLLAIIGLGAKWLLDTPSEVVAPTVQTAEQAQLPDASAAPDAAPETAAIPAVTGDEAPDTAPTAASVIEEKPTEADTVSYRLAIKPWGTIYVDGQERGVSPPLKKLALPAGKHKIRIVNPNFPDFQLDVSLSKNKSGTIEHDFAADSQ
jgi:hypothetical protein